MSPTKVTWLQVRRFAQWPDIKNKFEQDFPGEERRFVACAIDDIDWSKVNSGNITKFASQVQCDHSMNKESLQTILDNQELSDSINYVLNSVRNNPDNLNDLVGRVRQFKAHVQDVIRSQQAIESDIQMNGPLPSNEQASPANNDDVFHLDQVNMVIEENDLVINLTLLATINSDIREHILRLGRTVDELAKFNVIQEVFTRIDNLKNLLDIIPGQMSDEIGQWQQRSKMELLYKGWGENEQDNPVTKEKPTKKQKTMPDIVLQTSLFSANELDKIQADFEMVIKVISENKDRLINMDQFLRRYVNTAAQCQRVSELTQALDTVLANMIDISFIIEEQPIMIKVDKNFDVKCRFLFGNQWPTYGFQSLTVFLMEYNGINGEIRPVKKWEHENDVETNEDLVASYGNNTTILANTTKITLSKQKILKEHFHRAPSKGQSEGLAAQKLYCLWFQCQTNQQVFTAQSNPITVITHVMQKPEAWGSLSWQYMFQEEAAADFTQIGHFLSNLFAKKFNRGLTAGNLNFLRSKLAVDSDGRVTKNSMLDMRAVEVKTRNGKTETQQSFWHYFYHAYKLTAEHLDGLYRDHLVVGFISKEETQAILARYKSNDKRKGIFLLRFSETTEKGGICVSYYDEGLQNLSPISQDNMKDRTLADLLRNCRIKDEPDKDVFTHIYGEDQTGKGQVVQKQDAFEEHYTKVEKQKGKTDYLDALIQIFIEKDKKLRKTRKIN